MMKSCEIKKAIADNDTTIVVFSASWCGPCKMFAPIVDATEKQIGENATIIRCDIDVCEDWADEMGIASVPTITLFKNGSQSKNRTGGFPNVDSFVSWIG